MSSVLGVSMASQSFSGISVGAVVLGLVVAAVVAALLLAADRAVDRLADGEPCIGENLDVD